MELSNQQIKHIAEVLGVDLHEIDGSPNTVVRADPESMIGNDAIREQVIAAKAIFDSDNV